MFGPQDFIHTSLTPPNIKTNKYSSVVYPSLSLMVCCALNLYNKQTKENIVSFQDYSRVFLVEEFLEHLI